MMLKDFIELYRNSATDTGMSVLSGDGVASDADLPTHRIEIHLFRDAAMAGTFVAGMKFVGIGNSMAVTWQTGTTTCNRVVIIAKFDEPRPEGDLPYVLIEHTASNADSIAITAGMMERDRLERLERDQDERDIASLRAPLEALGYSDFSFGRGWLRWSGGFTATWEAAGGPYKLSKADWELLQGPVDMSGAIKAIADPAGVSFDPDDAEFVLDGLRNEDGVLNGVETLLTITRDCEKAKADLVEAGFRASVKMTVPRRRFLKTGADIGIRRFWNRGNLKASAGTCEIGQSEINVLVRIGWMSDADGKFAVTEAGKAQIAFAEA
jgi:hypothetical protein